MFKQRLITTLILMPLALLVLYYAPMWLFIGVLSLVLVGLYLEGACLIPVVDKSAKLLFALGLILFIGMSYLYLHSILCLNLILWMMIWLAVLYYPASQIYFDYRVLIALFLCVLFAGFFSSIIYLYTFANGKLLILYVFCLVWATDIGAYLIGKQWGRTRLIAHVSPGKTIEGALGGGVLAGFVSIIACMTLHPMSATRWFILSLGTVLMSMLGDLLISMLKRRCHLKDTGNLLPGHGGLLDRLDSAIAAFPFFVIFYVRWMSTIQ